MPRLRLFALTFCIVFRDFCEVLGQDDIGDEIEFVAGVEDGDYWYHNYDSPLLDLISIMKPNPDNIITASEVENTIVAKLNLLGGKSLRQGFGPFFDVISIVRNPDNIETPNHQEHTIVEKLNEFNGSLLREKFAYVLVPCVEDEWHSRTCDKCICLDGSQSLCFQPKCLLDPSTNYLKYLPLIRR